MFYTDSRTLAAPMPPMGDNAMVRFMFRLLMPMMFLFAVMMYFADFRLVAVGFVAAGYVSHLICEELSASG